MHVIKSERRVVSAPMSTNAVASTRSGRHSSLEVDNLNFPDNENNCGEL